MNLHRTGDDGTRGSQEVVPFEMVVLDTALQVLAHFYAFADGRNQTQAACTASEYAIHYSITSQHREQR